jgi:hypothetical protein
MKMDLYIDLVIISCRGKKTLVVTPIKDEKSRQRGRHPYLAQRMELHPDIPLLDVV